MVASSVTGSMTKIKSNIAEPIVNFVNRVRTGVSNAWDYAKNTNISDVPVIKSTSEGLKNGVKVVYCSSLIQQNNGESIHGHGYVIWDVDSCEYEFVELENPNYGFYKFRINDIVDIEEDKEVLVNL
jgi:hypothetical protein